MKHVQDVTQHYKRELGEFMAYIFMPAIYYELSKPVALVITLGHGGEDQLISMAYIFMPPGQGAPYEPYICGGRRGVATAKSGLALGMVIP
jgi:hypothetical protein